MINEKLACALLMEQDDILIVNHRRPDGDAVGSAAGLCAALRQAGKRAFLLENPDTGKNFLSYYEGYYAPEDFRPRYIVSVDTASEDMLQSNAKTLAVDLAIDHHSSHSPYAQETCLDACAACGELVLRVVKEMTRLTQEIARPLYLAVATDTGCFRYSNTTPQAHCAAAELMETGIDYAVINRENFSAKSLRRIRLETLLAEGMELCNDETVVLVSVTKAQLDALGVGADDLDDLANFARQVDGSLVGITVQELGDGACKVSVRSAADYVSASEVCALLGGGGHPGAAGCTLHGTVEQAKRAILDALHRTLEAKNA